MSNNGTKDEQLTAAFHALGNPNRLALYRELLGCCRPGTACDLEGPRVGDLGADLGIAPSTLSHHLKELSRAGLVTLRRQGRQVFCSADPTMAQRLGDFFVSRFSEGESDGCLQG